MPCMEKTVLVVVGNNLSSNPCGHGIALELSQGGKASKSSGVKSIPKSVWTCSVEAVSEYCRVVLDLFPDHYQVCVAAVDETKCQPINSWRDEDQDIGKVLLLGCMHIDVLWRSDWPDHFKGIMNNLRLCCLVSLHLAKYPILHMGG